jgi:hypothetical protein
VRKALADTSRAVQLNLFAGPGSVPAQHAPLSIFHVLPLVTASGPGSDAAIVVVGTAQELDRARQHTTPWEDLIVTTSSAWYPGRVHEWADDPQGPLFCTPAVLSQCAQVIGGAGPSLTVVLLSAPRRAEAALEILGRCGALSVLDSDLMVRTWSRIDAVSFGWMRVGGVDAEQDGG